MLFNELDEMLYNGRLSKIETLFLKAGNGKTQTRPNGAHIRIFIAAKFNQSISSYARAAALGPLTADSRRGMSILICGLRFQRE